MASTWPSSEVPTPNGIIGVLWRRHRSTMSRTSSVDSGNTTASGGAYGKYDSSLPWCSRTPREVVTRSPSSARISSNSAASNSRGLFTVSSRLFELDLAVEPYRELDAGDIERDRGREFLVALDRAPRARPGYRLLDLPLGTDPDHLQEFPDAEVEGVFVHDVLRLRQRKSRGGQSQSRFRSRASRPCVEASSPAVSPPSSSLRSSVRARFLPCSTPHWSKLFKFQTMPSTNTLCSCSAMSAPSVRGVRRSRSRVLEGRLPGRALCGAPGAGLPKARAAPWASALASRAARPGDDSPSRPITMKSTGMKWVPCCSS